MRLQRYSKFLSYNYFTQPNLSYLTFIMQQYKENADAVIGFLCTFATK